LRDNTREFHLALVRTGQWDLYPIGSGKRGTPVHLKAK
jgi:hypothetical protein